MLRKAALLALLLSCGCRRALPEQGMWNGTVELANGAIHLPFRMSLDFHSTRPTGYFLIGGEKALIPEIHRQGDSITFVFAEYGAQMRGIWNGSQLNGTYTRQRPEGVTSLNFSASPGDAPASSGETAVSPAGKYQVYFADESREKSATVATLWMQGGSLYGTFIAPDGDYGLLIGDASGGKFQLNRFTGWQAMAITLEQNAGNWTGNYYFLNDKRRAFTLEARTDLDVPAPAEKQTSIKNPQAAF